MRTCNNKSTSCIRPSRTFKSRCNFYKKLVQFFFFSLKFLFFFFFFKNHIPCIFSDARTLSRGKVDLVNASGCLDALCDINVTHIASCSLVVPFFFYNVCLLFLLICLNIRFFFFFFFLQTIFFHMISCNFVISIWNDRRFQFSGWILTSLISSFKKFFSIQRRNCISRNNRNNITPIHIYHTHCFQKCRHRCFCLGFVPKNEISFLQ